MARVVKLYDPQGRLLPVHGVSETSHAEDYALTALWNYRKAKKNPDLRARLETLEFINLILQYFAEGPQERGRCIREEIKANGYSPQEIAAFDTLLNLWNRETERLRRRFREQKRAKKDAKAAKKAARREAEATPGNGSREAGTR